MSEARKYWQQDEKQRQKANPAHHKLTTLTVFCPRLDRTCFHVR